MLSKIKYTKKLLKSIILYLFKPKLCVSLSDQDEKDKEVKNKQLFLPKL
ncbi:hypothetical protein Pf1_02537 [Flavobacterium columnare]|nr:hypothetical protein Pf1_02537 [Flavobacterium columnare]